MRWFAYLALAPLLGVGLLSTACGRTAADDFLGDSPDAGPSMDAKGGKDAPVPTCTDTVTDPHNCGVCGHDCQGGSCEAGVCQVLVLAKAEEFPSVLRVDDSGVYWMNAGGADGANVRAVQKGGGGLRTVATLPEGAMGVTMALDEGHAYWLTMTFGSFVPEGSLQRANKDGSELLTLFDHTFAFQFSTLVTDGTHVYWAVGQSTTAESPGLMRASPTGNEPLLWTRDGLPLVLSDGPDAIYAATNIGNEEEIVAYEKETGARRAILVATWVGSMTTNTSDIFYAHDFVAPGGNELRREWTRVSKQGGPAEVLRETSGLGAVTGDVIAADDERVYVAERDATFSRTTLVEMRTDGSSATPLWEAPSQIWALAIDDTSIYWVADDPNAVTRSILKLAKPAR